MPKVKFDERTESIYTEDYSNHQISPSGRNADPENITNRQNESFLNNLLSLVKLIFIYIPGAIAIHFVGMFPYFFILFGFDFSDFYSGIVIGLIAGMFLTMFGIGKTNDLKYLKVPAAIFTGSFLISILFALITGLTGIRLTGFFMMLSFPITTILGYLVKRILDKA
jgi:hypothetical protein